MSQLTNAYAVIATGGKQYRAQPGEILQVEKLPSEVGQTITFDKVLFWAMPGADSSEIMVGKPELTGAAVKAEVIANGRGEKIIIGKYKRRKNYRREQGHRQNYTQVIVLEVANGKGQSATLSADDKKNILSKFSSQLRVKNAMPKAAGLANRSATKPNAKTGTAKTSKTTTSAAPKKATAKSKA